MNIVKFRLIPASLAILAAVTFSDRSHAANATWTGSTSGSFVAGSNWSPAAAPGNTSSGTTSIQDIATFNNATNTNVSVDSGRTIGSMIFDTGAGAFTLGGSTLWLTTSTQTAGIVINAGATNSQIINSNLIGTRGGFTFANNSTTAGVNLIINGSFTASSGTTTVLTLNGSNNGILNGALQNGTSALGLVKGGAGTWTLTGINTYSGSTAIGVGTLSVSSIANNLGTSSGTIDMGSSSTTGTLLYTGTGESTARAFNLAGAGGGAAFNSSGSGALTITSNFTASGVGSKTVTLTGTNTGSNTISGAIVDNSAVNTTSLAKTSTGKWVLAGASTYTGATTLTGGELVLDFSAGTAPLSNIVSSTSTLILGLGISIGGVATTGTLSFIGKANTANSQTFSSGTTTLGVGAYHIKLGTSGTGTLALNLGAISATRASGFSLDLNVGAGTTVNTGTTVNIAAGVLPQGITINGSDFATISGSNVVAFTGYTANTSGTLGTTNQVVDMSGGNTTLAGATTTVTALRFNNAAARTVTLSSATTTLIVNAGILVTSTVGANTSTITGGILQGVGGRDLLILQNNTSGTLQIGSTIVQNTNGGNLTKSGLGDLLLSGTSSYSALNYINEGKVIVTADTLAGISRTGTSTAAGATLTGINTTGLWIGQRVTGTSLTGNNYFITAINSGANTVTLNLGTGVTGSSTVNFDFSAGSGLGSSGSSVAVQIASGATLQLGNGGTSGSLLDAQGVLNNGTLIFNRSNALTYSSTTSGIGSLVQAGSGTTTLAGSNFYTGATTITGGVLSITGTAALAGTSGISIGSGAGLAYTGAADTLAKNITVSSGTGTVSNTGGNTLGLSGTLSKDGSVLRLTGGAFNVSGQITGTSANSDLLVDAATVTLSGSNSYNGPTFIINSGTLNANVASALPTANGRTAVSLDQTGSGTSTLSLGASQSIASLAGAASSSVTLSGNTLTLGTTSGTTTFAGIISGANGALIKDGNSTQILSGSNSYTGVTTVSAGTLLINGNQTSATGTTSVSGGATLGGSGTSGGNLTVTSGGTLAPGNNSTGNLTLASLTLSSGAVSNFEISGTGAGNFDTITTTGGAGSITLAGTLNLIFGNLLANSSSIDLFLGPTTNTGDFSAITLSGTYSGSFTSHVGTLWTSTQGTQTLSFEATTGVLSAIPEPSTWALAGIGLGFTLMRLRRRR